MKPLPASNQLKLTEAAATGFFFCNGCQRITRPDSTFRHCSKCGSKRIKWCPPVPGLLQSINIRLAGRSLALN